MSLAEAFLPLRSAPRLVLQAALDMNDPLVNEQFKQVQSLSMGSINYELEGLGIPIDPLATDMDTRLMLMEARVRLTQKPSVRTTL